MFYYIFLTHISDPSHKLLKVSDKKLCTLSYTLTNNVAAIADEVVCRWRGFKISRTIANHHNLQRATIHTIQLARVEVPYLVDSFTLSTASTCRLIHVKCAVISSKIKQQLVGKDIGAWNAKLLRNWIDERMKSAWYQVNFLIVWLQMGHEFPAKESER